MAINLQLDPIHSTVFHPFGGIGEIGDDPFNVPIFYQLRKGAVRRFAVTRRGNRWQPIPLAPSGAAPQMR